MTAQGVEDINYTNQNTSINLNVTSSIDVSQDMSFLILMLVLFSLIPFIIILMLFRSARNRRRAGVRRSLRYTREFLQTDEDLEADTSPSYLLLAKAEAALARGAYNEAERLAGMAKESAMIAVAEQKK